MFLKTTKFNYIKFINVVIMLVLHILNANLGHAQSGTINKNDSIYLKKGNWILKTAPFSSNNILCSKLRKDKVGNSSYIPASEIGIETLINKNISIGLEGKYSYVKSKNVFMPDNKDNSANINAYQYSVMCAFRYYYHIDKRWVTSIGGAVGYGKVIYKDKQDNINTDLLPKYKCKCPLFQTALS